jgi:hypothetical protein
MKDQVLAMDSTGIDRYKETTYRDLRMPKTERGRKGVRGVLYIAECKLGHEKERGEEEVVIYRWLGE